MRSLLVKLFLSVKKWNKDRLADGSSLDDDFGALGGWIAATLVCVGDVALAEN